MMYREDGRPLRRSQAFVPQHNMFALPTPKGTRMLPGANGGSEWSPAAFSPQTGYLYVLGMHQPMLYKVKTEPFQPPAIWLGGAFVGTGEPQYGLFSAVDLKTGKIAWQKRVKDPMIGGAVATAGGVVFTGTKDRQFLALDAKSGRQLWRYQATGGVNGPPISYAIDGRQFVAVPAGGNFQINAPRSDELLVFALSGSPESRAAADTAAGATAGRGAR
jgi:glucose dehydrogenase